MKSGWVLSAATREASGPTPARARSKVAGLMPASRASSRNSVSQSAKRWLSALTGGARGLRVSGTRTCVFASAQPDSEKLKKTKAAAPKIRRNGRRIEGRVVMWDARSEEHTSELQSLMRTSYAFISLKKK